VQLSVQGEQRVKVAPERAELALAVSAEGSDRARIVAEVTAAANRLAAELQVLQDRGAAERYAVRPLQTYAFRPGRSAAQRFTATVDASVVFCDVEELGRYTSELATRPEVRLGHVRWFLTDATARRLQDECIEGAVRRARERAEAMARAAGAGALRIVEIADPGLLGAPEATVGLGAGPRMFAMAKAVREEAEPVAIVPEQIEVGALLQLRFAADAPGEGTGA